MLSIFFNHKSSRLLICFATCVTVLEIFSNINGTNLPCLCFVLDCSSLWFLYLRTLHSAGTYKGRRYILQSYHVIVYALSTRIRLRKNLACEYSRLSSLLAALTFHAARSKERRLHSYVMKNSVFMLLRFQKHANSGVQKPPSQLRFSLLSIIITITSNEPWHMETHKTDRNPPITKHKP